MKNLREKISDILEDKEFQTYPINCDDYQKSVDAILKAVREAMPPIEKAHTYASENADEYRAYDAGQEAYRTALLGILEEGAE